MPQTLKKEFYEATTLQIAKKLLGTYLIHESPEGKTIGRIVETEAYLTDDAACHASRGMTKRNEMMFGEPGHAYIYFIYGMYHCFNVVTAKKGIGEAVLIRALEPVTGIDLMRERRPTVKKEKDLCNGPAKLVLAMGMHKNLNGVILDKKPLYLLDHTAFGAKSPSTKDIVATTRIGITQDAHLPYRFYLKDNPHVSKKL